MNRMICPLSASLILLSLLTQPALAADIPQSATLNFSGSYGSPATMTFKRTGNQYTVAANINVPFYKIRFESGGTISGNQLNPSYYHDTRNGKLYASAQFSGNQITYGKAGETRTEAVSGRVMDLFTLSWQLAFSDGKLPANLRITNGKKLYPVNGISRAGSSQTKIDGVQTTVQQFNVRRGDDMVRYAFADQLGGVPANIQYNDGSKSYNLNLKSVTINGQRVQAK